MRLAKIWAETSEGKAEIQSRVNPKSAWFDIELSCKLKVHLTFIALLPAMHHLCLLKYGVM